MLSESSASLDITSQCACCNQWIHSTLCKGHSQDNSISHFPVSVQHIEDWVKRSCFESGLDLTQRLPFLDFMFVYPTKLYETECVWTMVKGWPCYSSGSLLLASHCGGPGLNLCQVMKDLWWTRWHWGRFSLSTLVSPANLHSTDCSTFIIYHSGLVQ
jgi:hypothetical protein